MQPRRLKTRPVCANLRVLSTASRHGIARLCAILFTLAQCEGASISEERGTSEERNITAHGVTLKLHGHAADTRPIGTFSQEGSLWLVDAKPPSPSASRLPNARHCWRGSVRPPSLPGRARRARILLLLADGVTITDIAAAVGMSRRHTYKWIQRFVQEGLAGLDEKPGRGRQRGPLPSDLRNQHDMDVG